MSDARLIEKWLPIAALGEESVRERRSMTSLPPTYYLHVWWARRPLVASRAAVLASLLTADADRQRFLHAVGIHGDPIAAKHRIAAADRNGERLGAGAYGYKRAFTYMPNDEDNEWISANIKGRRVVLDPTAGGGSIPFETYRLGLSAIANDLNPVASLIETATILYPSKFGLALRDEFVRLSSVFKENMRSRLTHAFSDEPEPDCRTDAYLWARTIQCPYCEGVVPLSPNWRLSPRGTGVRILPQCSEGPGTPGRVCRFEIVQALDEQSSGTVAGGDGTCPYPDCGRVIPNDEIQSQGRAGKIGQQLYAVVFKRGITTKTKNGKRGRTRWERSFRSPNDQDDVTTRVNESLSKAWDRWHSLDLIPTEEIPDGFETSSLKSYGYEKWIDLFHPRQLLCHVHACEVFREMAEKEGAVHGSLRSAALTYLAFSIDKTIDYNSRQVTWHSKREVMDHTFRVHGFRLRWSHAEMAPLVEGNGYDWATEQTAKCIEGLVTLLDAGNAADLLTSRTKRSVADPIISCKSGDDLTHIANNSVDAVVMDPPYYNNVMYAELSDFFYVWLKRTAGHISPEMFTRRLTDKESEAVANPSVFAGAKGASSLAGRHYQERMASIFAECRRVLKADGIMTLMFTHKATGAWDALTAGLMKAGFSISASWPINTEAEGSLHIKDKSAANSTVFLVCRPRQSTAKEAEVSYWEDVEPEVAAAVRRRVPEFQAGGITGVDLYLASFGPALEEFSKHWPLRRGTPRPEAASRKRRRQTEMFEETFDPYAVSPEDALEAARREVKTWRLNQLMHMRGKDDLDPVTSWFVLAWDAFKAPVFAYDEALRLARAVGIDLDSLVGRLCEKKGSDLKLWDSSTRAAKGALGPTDGSRGMIDVIHHVAHLGRTGAVEDARELLSRNRLDTDLTFLNALEAVLEVLPPSKGYLGFDVATGDAKASADDFDALERLRRLAFADAIDQPRQLELFAKEAAEAGAEVSAA